MHTATQPLAGWYVILPQIGARRAALARRLRALGAATVAVPGLRLAAAADPAQADAELRAALAAGPVVFTSPAAVRHARALPGWRTDLAGPAIAIGAGTAAALRRAGISAVSAPVGRGDSEAVLALPALRAVAGRSIGLVTAPGGRDRIAPALAARGARVCRAEVYRRLPPRLDAGALHALGSMPRPRALMLSSLDALDHLLAQLPPGARARLLEAVAVCASPRLVEAAMARGFAGALAAADASPAALVDALRSHANHGAFR